MNEPLDRLTTTSDDPLALQRWARRRDVAVAMLVWLVIAAFAIWALSHVISALLIAVVAALIAYALMPAVTFLTRYLPRWLAVLLVYVSVVSVLGALGYLVISTAVDQVMALTRSVTQLIEPTASGGEPLLVHRLEQLGLSQSQIQDVGREIVSQMQLLTSGALPFLKGVFNGVLDFILVIVLSIYMLLDGQRALGWLRTSAPLKIRPRVTFMLATLQRVVGGYIRGQLILSTVIGLLVGFGMRVIFHLPYAVLLGVLAFLLEFVPIVGVFISGATCVLIALNLGWITALLVLAYFVGVHIVEGDILGPRVVGKAVGVHPAVSIIALLAGAELFGVWGALFSSPLAGLGQALLSDAWREWRELHANQYAEQSHATVGLAGDDERPIVARRGGYSVALDVSDISFVSPRSVASDLGDPECTREMLVGSAEI